MNIINSLAFGRNLAQFICKSSFNWTIYCLKFKNSSDNTLLLYTFYSHEIDDEESTSQLISNVRYLPRSFRE